MSVETEQQPSVPNASDNTNMNTPTTTDTSITSATTDENSVSSSTSTASLTASSYPLAHSWVFWYSKPSTGSEGWQSTLKKVSSFSSVVAFWRVMNAVKQPSHLSYKQDYYVFKAGIPPEWDDIQNKDGGQWTIKLNKGQAVDEAWQETLLAAVGNQFLDDWELNGLVIAPRPKEIRLSIWTRTARDAEAQKRIGTQWKEFLSNTALGNNLKFDYQSHHDTIVPGANHRSHITYTL